MASCNPVCGICEVRNLGNISEIWCSECSEGLCGSCQEHHAVSRGTRTHKTFPIEEYIKLPAEILNIREHCDKHDEKFQTYCRIHNCPCCRVCGIEDHGKCYDKVLLEKVIQNVKKSSYFDETEHLMKEILETVSNIREDRENYLKSIREQRKSMQQMIREARIKLNNHLDKIENELRKEMLIVEEEVTSKTNELIASLDKEKNKLSEYDVELIYLKKYGSDLQAYCALNKIQDEALAIDQYLRAMVKNQELDRSQFSFTINTNLQDAILSARCLGKIKLESKPTTVKLSRNKQKQKQAQMMVAHMPSKSIDTIQVTSRRIIEMHGINVTGCLLLPGDIVAFSGYRDCVIRFINKDETQISEIPTGVRTFDIVYVEDKNSIAMTSGYGDKQCITIIDNDSKQVIKTIPVGSDNYGITYRNDTLYFCADDKGLRKINLHDNSVRDVCTGPVYGLTYVASFNDKLYYTDFDTVTCCDLQGKALWKFKDHTILEVPLSIDCDNDGNIYVVSNRTNNVVVISPDGSQSRQLLSASDGLYRPQALHFDRSSNILLVAIAHETAVLCDVNK